MGSIDNPINNSKGCGGVMRIAPVGLVAAEPFTLGSEIAALTLIPPPLLIRFASWSANLLRAVRVRYAGKKLYHQRVVIVPHTDPISPGMATAIPNFIQFTMISFSICGTKQSLREKPIGLSAFRR